MRRLCLVALSSLLIGGQAVAAGETCTSYLTAQREKMLAAATACEGTPTQQQSVRPQAERERNGDKVMSFAECSEPVAVAKADDIFRGCVRTHLCAAQTYTCAINSTTAHSTIKECGKAMTACQVTDPIPATPP